MPCNYAHDTPQITLTEPHSVFARPMSRQHICKLICAFVASPVASPLFNVERKASLSRETLRYGDVNVCVIFTPEQLSARWQPYEIIDPITPKP